MAKILSNSIIMKKILIIGAGYVASALIKYLLDRATQYDWEVWVGDLNEQLAIEKIGNHPRAKSIPFNVKNDEQREQWISQCDVVVSLLPASMHHIPAETCLKFNKHLITASYVSDQLKAFETEATQKGLLFMGEMGLDPGIDHMVIMNLIDEIEAKGGAITSLRSFTGGLIAPESDTNPWKYKFTWAPRNVVHAGQGTAQYKKNGRLKYIPYNRLFQLYDEFEIEGYGKFEAYANRDSLSYMPKYSLENIPTFIRGTLRKKGFCDAWAQLVKLGLTDDSFPIIGSQQLTYNELIGSFLPDIGPTDKDTLIKRIGYFLNLPEDGQIMKKLAWLELFDNRSIDLVDATPAQILQDLLEEKWALQPEDKDLIVMSHLLEYTINDRTEKLTSSLLYEGQHAKDTAMGRLVGVPLAIMTKLLLTNQINLTGIKIPIYPQVYKPALKELEEYGVEFKDAVEPVETLIT